MPFLWAFRYASFLKTNCDTILPGTFCSVSFKTPTTATAVSTAVSTATTTAKQQQQQQQQQQPLQQPPLVSLPFLWAFDRDFLQIGNLLTIHCRLQINETPS
eukprot:TRINITY_DN7215_c1_g1_i1.p1 TRINITY_DN7215_c1_g1~~TRINITY_DN7215_c1_g1_i1.p1  ORF type:complete len:102 (-),score=15.03 TRINITY_DN7215_c1_g1_i1:275-580(-)